MAWLGWVRAVGVAALVVGTGCYEWVAIKPADIPGFTAGPPHEVERADGRRVRFDGEVAVKVHTPNGTLTYWNPQANVEDETLAISGDSAPPAEIPLTAIDRAKVGQLSTLETALTIGISLAAAVFVIEVSRYTWFNSRGVD